LYINRCSNRQAIGCAVDFDSQINPEFHGCRVPFLDGFDILVRNRIGWIRFMDAIKLWKTVGK